MQVKRSTQPLTQNQRNTINEFIDRAISKEQKSLETLYHIIVKKANSICRYKYSYSDADVEDAIMDLYIKMQDESYLQKLKKAKNPNAYMNRTIRNYCIDEISKNIRHKTDFFTDKEVSDENGYRMSYDPQDQSYENQPNLMAKYNEYQENVFSTLTEQERTVWKKRNDNFKIKEISLDMNLSVGQVNTIIRATKSKVAQVTV